MDKNPDRAGVPPLSSFPDPLNTILCSDAFTKEALVHRMACHGSESGTPVAVLDLDLLYTGYLRAGMIKGGTGLETYTPSRLDWTGVLGQVAAQVSARQTILIVDSINGFFGIFDGKDAGMHANSCMMLLASCARQAGGQAFLFCIAGRKVGGDDDEWMMLPGGRRVLENPEISRFFAERLEAGIRVNAITPGKRSFWI